MSAKFVRIKINDCFDELREENNRLLNELKFSLKCNQLLNNYRNCLTVFNNNCKCDENIKNKQLFIEVENEYKNVFNNEKETQITGEKSDINFENNIQNIIKLEINSRDEKSINKKKNKIYIFGNDKTVRKRPKQKLKTIKTNNKNINENINNSNNSDCITQLYCEICKKTFLTKRQFHKHNKNVHSNKRLMCDWTDCQFVTKYERNLKTHQRIIHLNSGEKPFSCEKCDKSYTKKAILIQHIRAEHLNIKYKCDFNECKFETKNVYHLKEHKVLHTGLKSLSCEWPGCESRFATKATLRSHLKRIHLNERQYKCVWPQCSQSFINANLLETHVNRIHRNVRPYKCMDCEKSYSSRRELKQHIHVIHSETSLEYKCNECQYSTKRANNLKSHFKRHHSGVKPFKCEWNECQSCFVTNFELQEHHKCMHSNERPFVCEWPECGATFKFKQNLLLHYNSHTGLRRKRKSIQ